MESLTVPLRRMLLRTFGDAPILARDPNPTTRPPQRKHTWDRDGIGMESGWDRNGVGNGSGRDRDGDGIGMGSGMDRDGIGTGSEHNHDGVGMGSGWGARDGEDVNRGHVGTCTLRIVMMGSSS